MSRNPEGMIPELLKIEKEIANEIYLNKKGYKTDPYTVLYLLNKTVKALIYGRHCGD